MSGKIMSTSMRICMLMALCVIALAKVAKAQGPFDPDCYFPSFSDPSQIDSIYGSFSGQALGANLVNLGPWLDESYGRLAFQGHPSNPGAWTTVETGPGFDLHKLKVKDRMTFTPPGRIVKRGHFRSTEFTDIFVEMGVLGREGARIYWQDRNGLYDADRFSNLSSPIKSIGPYYGYIGSACADFDGDGLLDVVMSFVHVWEAPIRDSLYLAFYKGSSSLGSGTSILPDTMMFWFNRKNVVEASKHRFARAGDYRGVGREDIVFANPYGSLFYYRNDGDFSFDKYIQAVWHDTLLAAWQNPGLRFSQIAIAPEMQILPKAPWDQSSDLSLHFPVNSTSDARLSFYRGGPNFGSKRIFVDSASDFIRHPAYYDGGWNTVIWPGSLEDCGDMTGTGNKVIKIGASAGLDPTSMACFYVVGRALDSKIDMFLSDEYLVGYGDTITVNDDGLQDYIAGHGIYTSKADRLKGKSNVGMIYLIYGSKRIPVKINPKYEVRSANAKEQRVEITWSDLAIQLTFSWRSAETARLRLYNVQGGVELERQLQLMPDVNRANVDLGAFPPGTYFVEISSASETISGSFQKL